MLHNIKPLSLHCVFHGIRFKVNKDWVSGIDTLLFFFSPFAFLFYSSSRLIVSDKFPTFANLLTLQ